MGVCFSKRKEPSSEPLKQKKIVKEEKPNISIAAKKKKKKKKKSVSVVTATPLSIKEVSFAPEEKEKKKSETPTEEKSQLDNNKSCYAIAITASADNQPQVPMRSSSCTNEEFEAIFLQCGRLSRSSSGNASTDNSIYSGHKRREEEEEEFEKPVLGSRRTPTRGRNENKRSRSRERGSNGGRRVSRSPSPVKRLDGFASSVSSGDELKQQPEKMVSVPTREKGNSNISNENHHLQSQNWRIPMAEVDENALRAENHHLRFYNGGNAGIFQKRRDLVEKDRSPIRSQTQFEQSNVGEAKDISNEAQMKQQMLLDMVDKAIDAKKGMSSKNSSQDLENNSGYNPASHASLLLEDIQNSKLQKTPFSISTLKAAADFNSSCSEIGRKPFMESELFIKNKLMQSSFYKYVTVRNLEPQESIGSYSFVGQPWTSPWEPNSVVSTDRFPSSQRSRTPLSGSSSQTAASAAAVAATPLMKKGEIDQRKLLQDGERDSAFTVSAGTF